tara:strand:- start:231 stop:461 length:231 start_codon:yes stop_codon:yes gene_type:complete
MRRGHWEVKFKFWVEGKDNVVDLEDLSEVSQEHVINSIKEGYTSGELNEPIEKENNESDEDLEKALDFKIKKWGLE